MTTLSPGSRPTLVAGRERLRAWAERWWESEGPSVWAPGSWRQAVVGGLAVWVVVRVILSAWALFTVSTTPAVIAMPVPHTFFTLFYHWDSAYYEAIASGGYFAATSPANLPAFFPGYGIASRLATDVLFQDRVPSVGDITIGMWVAAAIPSVLAAIGFWKLAADRFGPRVALSGTVLLLAGPYSVFLAASYSEPLFLAFAVFAWYHALKGRWWVAGLLAAGASLARIDGVFLSIALGVLYLQSNGPAWRGHLSRAAGLVAIGLSTVIGYFVYLWIATGHPTEWLLAERAGWHRRFTLPWMSMLQTVIAALNPLSAESHRIQAWLEILFAVLCTVGGILLARRRRWGGVVLTAAMMASLATSTTLLSLSRESMLLFPLTILVASWRDVPGGRRRGYPQGLRSARNRGRDTIGLENVQSLELAPCW